MVLKQILLNNMQFKLFILALYFYIILEKKAPGNLIKQEKDLFQIWKWE